MARKFDYEDFTTLASWFHEWDRKMSDPEVFPKTGFIVDNVAAGFIYMTDSSLAIIDCYISNPESDWKTRSMALDMITNRLIEAAKIHKCRMIKCDTQLDAIKQRAKKFGFKEVGSYNAFIMEI